MSKTKSDQEPLTKFLVPAVGEVEAKDFEDLAKKLEQSEKEDGDGNKS